MASDANGNAARTFGVYLDDAGLALRGAFLVSPDQKLMVSMITFLNAGRNIDELLRLLKANIYLGKKTNEGCPSKWKDEGDKTLAPSAKMVGRVHEALQ